MEPGKRLTLRDRCRPIELLVADVDGVLTAGGIVHGSGGLELKVFHVRDGTGLRAWADAGKRSAIITGRTSAAVEVRARELGIAFVAQGAADKRTAFRRLLFETSLSPRQACCIGDDLADLPLLGECGLAVAVADACAEARSTVHYVTRAAGGQGAVRETIELILRCQGWRPQR